MRETITAFIGTYTRKLPHVDGQGRGIYRARYNPNSGALTDIALAAEIENPTFLALAPNKRVLYAIGETDAFDGQPGGSVSAFTIDPDTHALTLLNRQPSRGGFACHLGVDATGQAVIVANYGTGSVAAFPIAADGSLGVLSDFVQHEGSGPNPNRQQGPHAHQAVLSPDNRFVLVNDLGTDHVVSYALDATQAKITRAGATRVHPGAGPRHLAFHPNGAFAYVINELDATVTACRYDAERGQLIPIQTISTLPSGATAPPSCADIHVHPSGRFVYGSNRNHDSIAIFGVGEHSGKLSAIGHESTQGQQPRNFALAPDGRCLLAENQDSDTIVSFHIDPERGTLMAAGHVAQVPTPVCMVFLA